jgi:hypothetical protein
VNNGPVTWAALGSLSERVARLEEWHAQDQQRDRAREEHSRARGNRAWVIILGITTGIVCPVVVTSILAWLHLRGGG